MNDAAMNSLVQVFVCIHIFNSFIRYIPSSGIGGSLVTYLTFCLSLSYSPYPALPSPPYYLITYQIIYYLNIHCLSSVYKVFEGRDFSVLSLSISSAWLYILKSLSSC